MIYDEDEKFLGVSMNIINFRYEPGEIQKFFSWHFRRIANAGGIASGELIMNITIQSYDELVPDLAKDITQLYRGYVARCPIENGCYPIVENKGTSIAGHLHFSPIYEGDGNILEKIVQKMHQLCNARIKNMSTKICIKSY